MLPEHYIQWIELLTPTDVLRHELKPGEKPEAIFLTNAEAKDINGVAHGQMILQLPEDTAVAQKMIQYLKDRNLEVEELDHYVG